MQPGGVMERNLVLSRKLAQATTAGVGVVSKANVDVVVAPLGAFGRDMLIPSPGIGWMPCTGYYVAYIDYSGALARTRFTHLHC